MNTRLGVLLPTRYSQWKDARRLLDFGRRAERLGYDSVWADDTLIGARAEPLATLAALAAVTEQVTLGHRGAAARLPPPCPGRRDAEPYGSR